ncbi:Atxe2 family lasso peptide isopeptidase [Sphingopyxis terrae]|nr:Atxe2 family lasso peptide isopeptidase [Sphingopyxis terrae]
MTAAAALAAAPPAVPTANASQMQIEGPASHRQITIGALTEVADISGLAASPDGRWVAYRVERPSIVRNVIDTHWYVVASDGRSLPRRIGSGGTATWNSAGLVDPGRAIWLPNSRGFAVRAQVDGRIGLWMMPIEGDPYLLLERDGDVERFAIASDGRIVAEVGPSRDALLRAETDARDHGILMDAGINLASGTYRSASFANRDTSERWTGHWFESAPLMWDAPRQAIIFEPASGLEIPASAAERALLETVMPSPPPDGVAAATSARRCPPAASACRPYRLASSLTLEGDRWLLTMIGKDLDQHLYLWDDRRRRLEPIADRAGLLNGGRQENSSCTPAGDALFCVEAAADQPPRLVRLSLYGGTFRAVASPNQALADDGLVVEPVGWRVSGSRASGWLIRPKIPGRLPLFITYYRCAGYLRGGMGDEWPLRPLAHAGIAALCINAIPGVDTPAESRYATALDAVRSAIDLLDHRGLIDRSRVGMGGLSFGSEVTMWVAAHSDLLHAASIASAQIEPSYYWMNSIADHGRFANDFRSGWGLGAPDETPKRWTRLAPAAKVGAISAPILMQMPEKEARLSPELHTRLLAARKGALYIFPLAPHIKVAPRQKFAAYRRNFDWFRYWLQGHIDPDRAKADQYANWAELDAAP